VNLSSREVFDLADRCFAATGFAAGPAGAYAKAVWWTEAYRGTGLTTLHGLLDDLPDLERTAVTLEDRESMVAAVDGGGQPALISAPPTLDLCCARADRRGFGVAHAMTAAGGTAPTLGHVAYRAAKRGFVAVVLYWDGEAGGAVVGTPDQPHPLLAERDLDAAPASYARLLAAVDAGLDHGDGPLTQAVFTRTGDHRHPTADERLVGRLLERSTEPAASRPDETGFVTLCIDPGHPRYPDRLEVLVERFVDESASRFTSVYRPAAVQERAETLLREGVEVDREVWRDVFDCSSGILAPPFEGSHQGAGFDINE
jgi:hypothetical protein